MNYRFLNYFPYKVHPHCNNPRWIGNERIRVVLFPSSKKKFIIMLKISMLHTLQRIWKCDFSDIANKLLYSHVDPVKPHFPERPDVS